MSTFEGIYRRENDKQSRAIRIYKYINHCPAERVLTIVMLNILQTT